MAKGFAAVTQDGNILVDTVSSQDRGAMVSWFVVHGGFTVPRGMGDFAIRDLFERLSLNRGVTIQKVEITTDG